MLDPTTETVKDAVSTVSRNLDDRLDYVLPKSMHGGTVMTVNLISGSVTGSHGLQRYPAGWLPLNGATFSVPFRDNETIVFTATGITTGSLIWVF
jgi:hypothetical protein